MYLQRDTLIGVYANRPAIADARMLVTSFAARIRMLYRAGSEKSTHGIQRGTTRVLNARCFHWCSVALCVLNAICGAQEPHG